MKLKIYIHDWQCPGCYYKAIKIYSDTQMSKEEDAPLCCGCHPMLPVNILKIKIKK